MPSPVLGSSSAVYKTFLKILNKVTIQQLPATAAPGRSAHGNRTTGHSASRQAARHKTTAAVSRGEKLVPAAGSVSSAVTLTAALRKWQRTPVEIRPFEPT
jgi:hypothetical protein